jgi:hypothetical protein
MVPRPGTNVSQIQMFPRLKWFHYTYIIFSLSRSAVYICTKSKLLATSAPRFLMPFKDCLDQCLYNFVDSPIFFSQFFERNSMNYSFNIIMYYIGICIWLLVNFTSFDKVS